MAVVGIDQTHAPFVEQVVNVPGPGKGFVTRVLVEVAQLATILLELDVGWVPYYYVEALLYSVGVLGAEPVGSYVLVEWVPFGEFRRVAAAETVLLQDSGQVSPQLFVVILAVPLLVAVVGVKVHLPVGVNVYP